MIMSRKTGRFLMCKRSEEASYPNTWATWGGKTEFDETPEQTARREVFEETGYRLSGTLRHIFRFDLPTFCFDTFVAIEEDEFEPRLNAEASEARWMALEEIPGNTHQGLGEILEDRPSVKLLVRIVEGESGRPCDFDSVYRGSKE